jgi:hypothetical protein
MAKPNKRQKAILQLLAIVDQEGLHYGLVNYGVEAQLKAIKDTELNNLVAKFNEITESLEEKLAEYAEEVTPFTDDDVDF